MSTKALLLTALCLLVLMAPAASAQQAQIPTLQVCNETNIRGSGEVKIAKRADATHAGVFTVTVELRCAPKNATSPYPQGTVTIEVDLNDSLKGKLTLQVEQVTVTGEATPTAYLSGRCRSAIISEKQEVHGHCWVMMADNGPRDAKPYTADIVGFLMLDGLGKRVAYGTGPLRGDIAIAPNTLGF